MRTFQIIILSVALAVHTTTAMPEKGKKEGKSAQNRVTFSTSRDDRDRDNDLLFGRDRNTILASDLRRPATFTATPRPTVISVTTPGSLIGGFDGRVHSPHTIVNPVGAGDILGGGLGLDFLFRDPNYIINNPHMLILFPRLAIMHSNLIFQYPQLRHYVSPFVMDIIERRVGINTSPTFARVFPGDLGNTRFLANNGGIDFNRPIDVNRPFVATTLSPIGGFRNNPGSIRF